MTSKEYNQNGCSASFTDKCLLDKNGSCDLANTAPYHSRPLFSSESFLSRSYLNNEDVINEFRHVFLEDYLEKNKIGRKSKSVQKTRSKFRHLNLNTENDSRKSFTSNSFTFSGTQAINIPRSIDASKLKRFKNHEHLNQSDSNIEFEYFSNFTNLLSSNNINLNDRNDLNKYLDNDLFSFNMSPILTTSTSNYNSENGSFYSQSTAESECMSYKKVDIDDCINSEEFCLGDHEDFSVKFFEPSDMVRAYDGINFLKEVTLEDLCGEEEGLELSENRPIIQDMSFQFDDDQKVNSLNLGRKT